MAGIGAGVGVGSATGTFSTPGTVPGPMPEHGGQDPSDEANGPEDAERRAHADEAPRPGAPAPDHGQARQGTRDPARPLRGPRAHGPARMSDADATSWAAGAHLASLVAVAGVPSILGPLVVWLVKREDHPFVADQAREALNFQISVLIYAAVGAVLAFAFTLATMGVGLLAVVPAAVVFVVGVFLLPILAAVKASEGERYRYPLTLRLVSGPDAPPNRA